MRVSLTANASGAVYGAELGHLILIVDVCDMSTSLEAALDAGAIAVFGASPDDARPPVPVDPFKVGVRAGEYAQETANKIILIAEPRTGPAAKRWERVQKVCQGINSAGAKIEKVIPNLGKEIVNLCSLNKRVVIAVTNSGGVAFDAALTAGAPVVCTGTIARTTFKKGIEPAQAAATRALESAQQINAGITVVAASSNSLEDLLAAEYIYNLILQKVNKG